MAPIHNHAIHRDVLVETLRGVGPERKLARRGHDVEALRKLFKTLPLDSGKPTAIICHTVKGKGLPFAENKAEWHHKSKVTDKDVVAMVEALGSR